ncbi:hypothetical protein LTR65_004125 [Meristemomyces frigidus]
MEALEKAKLVNTIEVAYIRAGADRKADRNHNKNPGPSCDKLEMNEDKYEAIKMPRADYKRYFVRDKNGNYAGTEPERQWCESEVMREFSAYQDMPLRSILC